MTASAPRTLHAAGAVLHAHNVSVLAVSFVLATVQHQKRGPCLRFVHPDSANTITGYCWQHSATTPLLCGCPRGIFLHCCSQRPTCAPACLLTICTAGMGIEDFSTADQWAPLAKQSLAKAKKRAKRRQAAATWRAQPLYDLASLAVPLKLTV